METAKKIGEYTLLTFIWINNGINPTYVGVFFGIVASIAATIHYRYQYILSKRKELRDQEAQAILKLREERDKIIFEKQMKAFEDQYKVNKN